MKIIEIAVPQLIGGEWKYPENGNVDVDDDVADTMERGGLALIVSHNGVPVVWSACCNEASADCSDHNHKEP